MVNDIRCDYRFITTFPTDNNPNKRSPSVEFLPTYQFPALNWIHCKLKFVFLLIFVTCIYTHHEIHVDVKIIYFKAKFCLVEFNDLSKSHRRIKVLEIPNCEISRIGFY